MPGVHNIQPFTMLEMAVDLAAHAHGRVILGSVITGADAYAVPVRLFNFYGLPANVDDAPEDGDGGRVGHHSIPLSGGA